MKNNKAFTLVELLSVVTILTILALVITPMIDSNIKKSREKARRIQIETIRMAGQAYFTDNMDLRPEVNQWATVRMVDLLNDGYIDSKATSDKFGLKFYKTSTVEIKNDNGKYIYLVCVVEECD